MKKLLLIFILLIITSCVPRELVIVDPVTEYGEYRSKRFLLLNINRQDGSFPVELESLSRNTLYKSFQRLKSVEFLPYDIPSEDLNIDLTESNLKKLGMKYEADIIITGQINAYQEWQGKRKQLPPAYIRPLIKNIKSDTDLIEALIKTTFFFIDIKSGKVIWTKVIEWGDIEPIASENKIILASTPEERKIALENLRQKLLNDIMKALVNDLMPYYDYR